MKYFKVFNTESEYHAYVQGDDFIAPNVSTLYDCTKTWILEGREVIHVTGVTLNESSISLLKDNTFELEVTVTPNDATNKSVTWSSSNENVATVDSNGVVSGVASGDATITVTTVDGGLTAQCSVSVAEYTELEYIASTSTGGQYIDLDIMLYDELNKWYDIAIKFNAIGSGKTSSTNQPTIFGCQDNTGSPWPGTFIRKDAATDNMIGRWIGANTKDKVLGQLGNDIELSPKDAPNMNVYNLNNSGKTHTWGTSLFCIFNNQAKTTFDRFIEAKLYYFKLYSKASKESQGVLVRDMMPCRNSEGVVGLLDKVNNVFYSSPNGAAFVAGPEVNA